MNLQTRKPRRRARTIALLAGALLCALRVEATQHFYSVDFDGPMDQVCQPPMTGVGPGMPSRILSGEPTVVESFGQLRDQPLLFSGNGAQALQFNLGMDAPNYFLDFDFETRHLKPSQFFFKIVSDNSSVESFSLDKHGRMKVPGGDSMRLPGWSDDDMHHLHFALDLESSCWTLQLDDHRAVRGELSSCLDDILSIRLGLNAQSGRSGRDAQFAIDNILIGTTVPEPSTLALTFTALGVTMYRRIRRTTPVQ